MQGRMTVYRRINFGLISDDILAWQHRLLIPTAGRQRQVDLCEASLVYTESSRPARVT